MQACDRCHARKIRCDRRAPRCSVCERVDAQCIHTDRTRDRKIPRGYVQSLEDKIRILEERSEYLQNTTTTAGSSHNPCLPDIPQSQPRRRPTAVLEHTWNGTAPSPSIATQELREINTSNRAESGDVSLAPVSSPPTPTTTSRHYLGSSTNVDFVKVVASNFQGSLALPVSAEDLPSPEPPVVPHDAAIPPRSMAQGLIDAYFAHWHITFPLLHRASLQRVVDQIYSQPEFYKKEIFHAFAFDVVLAMGSVSRNRHEWSAMTTESYFARAMNKLDKVLRLPDVMPLQALLLCCHYGVFSTLRDTSTDTWHLLGLAARFSTELGLHRRHGYKPNAQSTPGVPRSEGHESEMAKRCFWCLYNLDRVVSQTLGRPVAIRDDEIDALLPSRFDDDCSESEHWIQGGNGEWACPFIEIISLRRLSGRIHQSLHMNLSLRNLPQGEKDHMRDALFDELALWHHCLSTLTFDVWNHSNSNSTSPFLNRAWYDVIYYNAAITLYRPSPLFPFDSNLESAEDVVIMKKLWTFSRSSIIKYSDLLQQRRLNYSWITLYAVFMAGLSYVYSVSRLSKKARQLPPSMVATDVLVSYMDVIHDTRLCSNILVAICERWNDARGSCSIFDRLSTAAIQELISASTNLHPQGPSAAVSSRYSERTTSALRTEQDNPHDRYITSTLPLTALPIAAQPPPLNYLSTTMHHADLLVAGASAPFEEHSASTDHFDFEDYFQELHGSLFQSHSGSAGGSYPSNEVLLGFDQDWFGVQS